MNAAFYRNLDPEDLPVPDAQLIRLIQCTLNKDAQVENLTRLISVNPSLTAQLLGFVNSAFLGLRQSIETVSDAVVVLGMDSLRNLVLCFAVKDALAKKKIVGFNMDTFWGDSIRRGAAARQLAGFVNAPKEQAFTAGMLQDIGLLALFFMEPEKADRWPLLRSNLPESRREMETALFDATHDQAGFLLAQKWCLPKAYATAIGDHHSGFSATPGGRPEACSNPSVLSGVMHLADLCNAVYACHDKSGALVLLKKQAKAIFKLNDADVESLLSSLPDQVTQASAALKIRVGHQLDFDTIMEQANRKLVQDNLSYQELTWKLQRSLKERDEYAQKLEKELDIAREIQKSLQPDIDQIHQVCAFNLPAFHLSGDFYDYFMKQDGTICFCLGDVSGKGTAAALLMAKTVSLFRCLCKVVDDLGQIVQLMNNELCETAVRGMFVTFVGGWLNPETCDIHLVNVGHLPPFLMNREKIVKIEPSDPPLGVMPGALHPARKISIKNKRLYLYTDGFTEGRLIAGAQKDIGKELGVNGYLRWLIQSQKMSLKDQTEWLKHQCSVHLAPQSDDLTLMILSGEAAVRL